MNYNYSKAAIIEKQHELRSISTRMISKWRVFAFRVVMVVAVCAVIIGVYAGYGAVKGIIDCAPELSQIDINPEGFASTIYFSDGTVSGKLTGAEANRVEVDIEQVPEVLQHAFVALEDERFYDHDGIDIRGIFRAGYSVFKEGDLGYGASTIDQQLLKNRVFNNGNESNAYDKIVRKIQEQYLAIQLEHVYTKNDILEAYMNTINLGNKSYGVEKAAENYFGKKVEEITLSEAAVIASIALSPVRCNPITNPEKNAERRLACLNTMLKLGYCSKSEYDEALKDDVYTRIKNYNEQKKNEKKEEGETYYSYFQDELVSVVIEDLQEKLGMTYEEASTKLYNGGLSIYTTQDREIQEVVDRYYCDESNFPAMGNDGGSFYELSKQYAVSILHSDGTQTHYNRADFLEYYSDYNDRTNNFYHAKYPYNHTGISQYTVSTELMDELLDAYINSLLKDGDQVIAESNRVYTLQPESSFVLINQENGGVVAIYGGRGEKTGSLTLNRATKTLRQIGSTFKVLASFLPALDGAGMTLASVVDDALYYYPNTTTKVDNWNGEVYKGLMPIRQGIINSMNVVACRVLEKVTPELAFSYLKKLGFTTLVESETDANGRSYTDISIPLALGGITHGVTNLELTAAYATIAGGGVYHKPIYYTKILDYKGNVLLENDTGGTQVIKNSTAWLLTDAMVGVTTEGTGKRLAFRDDEVYSMIKEHVKEKLGLSDDEVSGSDEYKTMVKELSEAMTGIKVAGKTGTTHDYTDEWFVGFTTHYTAGIWTGFDNNLSQINKNYHQNLWRKLMEEIAVLKETPAEDWEMPDSIVTAKICTKCGNLAVDGLCDRAGQRSGETTKVEYFAKGTVPVENCTCHVAVRICADSGGIAGPYCPNTYTKIYLRKDETSYTWDSDYVYPSWLKKCKVHTSAADLIVPDTSEEDSGDDSGSSDEDSSGGGADSGDEGSEE